MKDRGAEIALLKKKIWGNVGVIIVLASKLHYLLKKRRCHSGNYLRMANEPWRLGESHGQNT
jgi:hypothetical protein